MRGGWKEVVIGFSDLTDCCHEFDGRITSQEDYMLRPPMIILVCILWKQGKLFVGCGS